ncbi:PaaI family thioesterase [Guptibacillus hwajinpoensis]|uniref:Uncharacterized protein (TIGR00369 family) n=1 Tax=Guptibacillus hwajinpoensis TaxID=208199 RepID=A0ABU0K079_9BACL|nr:PaaI family thioesterase [Alkalihalobacillus hemicentroti]MDQ0482763.1 uncharacterized protein (TIGR00369 family) [Alkalihalobacillus hemicentroti]
MEKEKIHALLSEILEKSTNEERKNLYSLLEGVKKKQSNHYKTYLAGYLGINSKLINDNTYESIIPNRELIHNPLQIAHGGVTASLIDIAMGSLVHQSLPSNKAAVTSEMNIHYLAKGSGKELRCNSHVLLKSETRWVVKADVFRDDQTIIATATGNFMIIPKRV